MALFLFALIGGGANESAPTRAATGKGEKVKNTPPTQIAKTAVKKGSAVPILKTVHHLLNDSFGVAAQGPLSDQLNSYKIKTLFVFVPDPNASTLALEADRSLDAVRLALSDEGCVPYKSTELPWRTTAPESSKTEKHKTEDKIEEESGDKSTHPGIWLFRS